MIKKRRLFDIHDYIEMALRRKWYVIIPLGVSLLVSFGVYRYLPKIYKATTLILVQPQTVPENYVRSTITDSVVGRLNTISQEILSRTRLEKVIHEFNLYADLRNNVPMEGIVEMMRNAVEVKVEGRSPNERTQNSFSISYEGSEPRTVMLVTNKLASLFIEENLRVRESQAEGTSEFLTKELKPMEEKLKEKEVQVRNFKERYMGQLPQQVDANLRILERLQQQLQTTSEGIRSAEDRMFVVQNQIEELKGQGGKSPARRSRGERASGIEDIRTERTPEDPVITQWNQLQSELRSAQGRYTENHPDILDLKRKIAKLEPLAKESLEKQNAEREARLKELKSRREADSEDLSLAIEPGSEKLLAQYSDRYNEAQLEAKRLRAEEENIKKQIAIYQKRIEDTPKVEQELVLLTRDYDLMRSNYQSLLDKRIQAQLAENLERKQQGEQFKVLDPARIPETPIKPDVRKILYMGALVGLMAGVGLAWFRESLDQSFHTETDVEFYLGIPVIATIANRKNENGRYRGLQRAGQETQERSRAETF